MQRFSRRSAVAAVLSAMAAAAALPACAQTTAAKPKAFEPQVGQAGKDVVWVPTPDEVVEKMLDMAQVGPKDLVVDLGSGDGKIAIAAAKRGAKARGIEFNPDMVALSKRNAQLAGVKVDFQQGDIFKSDFRQADVVTLYLLPNLNERLKPILLDMKPGTRVTSHQFLMGDWEPDETVNIASRQAHFWRVPAKVAGDWQVQVGGAAGPRLTLKQTYQKLEGEADWNGAKAPLREPRIAGEKVSFALADAAGAVHRFEGTADHKGRMSGTVVAEASGQKQPFTAARR